MSMHPERLKGNPLHVWRDGGRWYWTCVHGIPSWKWGVCASGWSFDEPGEAADHAREHFRRRHNRPEGAGVN